MVASSLGLQHVLGRLVGIGLVAAAAVGDAMAAALGCKPALPVR